MANAQPHASLIKALQDPARYDHPVTAIHVIETHISWIVLTGPYAYKIKKPVDLGFLDFSTLDKRRFYCEEELRLNRRFAPQLYLEVVRITGTPGAPVLNGPGNAIEYAVKMVQFPQEAQLDRVVARNALKARHVDWLAQRLAEIHAAATVCAPDRPYGTPEAVFRPVGENFRQIGARLAARDLPQLERLRTWSESTAAQLAPVFERRKRDGFIRECHGDAHLGNVVLLEDRIVFFDCLEFNESLRWIDVMSDVAFLVMDLEHRKHTYDAHRCLNAYLEHTGDYAGLEVLRFYQAYRALVRAKVACIRAQQEGLEPEGESHFHREYQTYADLAESYSCSRPAALLITHGVAATGKTTAARLLVKACGAIHIRSDVERKRLRGLAPLERSGSEVGGGLYTAAATEKTYQRLAELAGSVIKAGFPVVVDATFLKRAHRDALRAAAGSLHVPFVIFDIQASERTLRERILARQRAARDASEASVDVLGHQLASHEPLAADEMSYVVTINSEHPPEQATLLSVLERIQRSR